MVQNCCLENGQQILAMEVHLLTIPIYLLVAKASKMLDHFLLANKVAAIKRTLLVYMLQLLSH